ncbi:MAG: helix-turn-helix transcriptional regulator [Clostridiaceae bacterium]|nr:helix-turn-helix transcriptional regulator [Clostridiaceae bacterium]
METVGNRLKSLRKHLGLTQTKFGKKVGISHSHVSNMESGKDFPSDTLLKLICLEYAINPEWLINGEGDMFEYIYDENDRVISEAMSVEGLEKIRALLNTSSDVKYAYLSYSTNAFAKLLDFESIPLSDQIDYLSCIESIVSDIERINSIMKTSILMRKNTDSSLEEIKRNMINHQKQIKKDIDKLFEFYISLTDKSNI